MEYPILYTSTKCHTSSVSLKCHISSTGTKCYSPGASKDCLGSSTNKKCYRFCTRTKSKLEHECKKESLRLLSGRLGAVRGSCYYGRGEGVAAVREDGTTCTQKRAVKNPSKNRKREGAALSKEG